MPFAVSERGDQRENDERHYSRAPSCSRNQRIKRSDDRDVNKISDQQAFGSAQRTGKLHAWPDRIICAACFNASGVTRWPESIRPISRVRASPVNSSTSATVRPFTSRFST